MKAERIKQSSALGHPYEASTYADRLNPRNARIAAEMAKRIFPDFDEQSRRIRARRMKEQVA